MSKRNRILTEYGRKVVSKIRHDFEIRLEHAEKLNDSTGIALYSGYVRLFDRILKENKR